MRIKIAWTLFLPFALSASALLDSSQMSKLNRYNHRASVGHADMTRMKRYAKISPQKAAEIAQKACGTTHTSRIVLKRKGRMLYYEITGVDGRTKINALDGEVIRCAGERR